MNTIERRVVLTATEMMVASYVGSARNVQSLTRRWLPAAGVGTANTWTPNVEGAAGEMAVAKVLGIYWQPIIGNHLADDVGPYQVRTNISRKHDDLCLRPKDRDDRLYISVLSFAPEFVVLGFIKGADGKQQAWLRDGSPERPQCFYVPRTALRDLDELPTCKEAA
ncbi:hypothetical protein [Bradyrhizobium sp. USDA 313]|uniref:hypothetical protein n=1 Tax=Bradyrhizobium sp. USDA 313 TaxID=3156307 RepID=UPI0035144508